MCEGGQHRVSLNSRASSPLHHVTLSSVEWARSASALRGISNIVLIMDYIYLFAFQGQIVFDGVETAC